MDLQNPREKRQRPVRRPQSSRHFRTAGKLGYHNTRVRLSRSKDLGQRDTEAGLNIGDELRDEQGIGYGDRSLGAALLWRWEEDSVSNSKRRSHKYTLTSWG